ncbi:hypothetical protein IAQ61_004350 [Plenodomus lingam]|uniref:uncharacterized protein n=1 Tax=Leptosphaeria maculans TaxID=5022 RepID=UPI003320052B|nr:hypothetical protein IAQ61_004350 [Plenodomus lingam]
MSLFNHTSSSRCYYHQSGACLTWHILFVPPQCLSIAWLFKGSPSPRNPWKQVIIREPSMRYYSANCIAELPREGKNIQQEVTSVANFAHRVKSKTGWIQ